MIASPARTILFATDFSDCALRAQDYALYWAGRLPTRIDVFHVVDCPRWLEDSPEVAAFLVKVRREVDRQLEDVRKLCESKGLEVTVRQVTGLPGIEIPTAALDTGVELIVLGARGSSGSSGPLLGGVVERVTKTAPCPVLTVPLPGERAGAQPVPQSPPVVHRILAPVDFSKPSLESVEYAVDLAQKLDATLELVHVVEPGYQDLNKAVLGEEDQTDAPPVRNDNRLRELVSLIKSFGLPGDALIRGGVPSDAILACAQEQRSDLIVMGTHGRRGFSRLRFGSVVETVLRLASCPVLTVKGPKFAPDHRRVVPTSWEEKR
ncbi:MAG: universal stress protein [Nitrospira sp.]|nr:universal stress protein [Nitrospira sp.]